MADMPLLHRKEVRVPLKMFVNLRSSDNPSAEIAATIDISCHGARVVTRKNWQPDHQLSIQSIRGNLKSLGRVVHCQPCMDNRFVIGIEIYSFILQVTGRNTTRRRRLSQLVSITCNTSLTTCSFAVRSFWRT